MEDQDTPTIGQIVHYVNFRSDQGAANSHRPGMIVNVWYIGDPDAQPSKENLSPVDIGYGMASVDLAIFTPSGMFFNKHVAQDEVNKSGGTWHWPER